MDLTRLPWYLTAILVAIGLLLIAWLAIRVASSFKKADFGLAEFSGFAEKVFTKGVFGAFFALGLLLILGLSVVHFVLGMEIGALSDGAMMRGLIALLFSIIGAAMFIAVALGAFTYPKLEEQAFERVRGVMTQLVTILGTIIGFYFGSVTVEQSQDRSAALGVEMGAIPTALTPTDADSVLIPLDATATGGTKPYHWEITADGRALTLDPLVQRSAETGRLAGHLWIGTSRPDLVALTFTVRDEDGHSRSISRNIPLASADAPVVRVDTAVTGPVAPPDTTQ